MDLSRARSEDYWSRMSELASWGPHGASEEMGPETAENLPKVKRECKTRGGPGLFLPDLGLGVRRSWAQLWLCHPQNGIVDAASPLLCKWVMPVPTS